MHEESSVVAAIREITIREAEIVTGLIQRGFQDVAERFGLTPEKSPTFVGYMDTECVKRDFANKMHFFLIEEDGHAAGCVGAIFTARLCWMDRLVVLPEYRKRGFGSRLVEHVEREAARLKLLRIDLDMVNMNRDLYEWYRRRGYHSRWTEFRENLKFSARIMYKLLGKKRAGIQVSGKTNEM